MSPRLLPPRPVPPHDPAERVLLTRIDGWLVRDFAHDDPRQPYFATRGLAHFQLWHPGRQVSVLTPPRLTEGVFEVFPIGGWKRRAADWQSLAEMLRAHHDLAAPSEPCLRAFDRWFPHLPESLDNAHGRGWSCLVAGEEGPGICPACLIDVFRRRGGD